ncbi:hypothetical protein [Aestuariivirga sp.]|uniref:hypothetical protein n=1 Tax=Aestuariivirga sp. TaxID=2650926 RepID=UPI0039E3D8E9
MAFSFLAFAWEWRKPLAVLALAIAIWSHGYHTASRHCHDAELRVEIASLKRDLAAAEAAKDVADVMIKNINAENEQLERENADAEKARPADPQCRYDPADLEWLHKHGR